MINKQLIERMYDAASIQRWNDHVRPMDLSELDKQAHKMIIAWMLARLEEDAGATIDWIALIEGGMAEFFSRVIMTDIKPVVFRRMMAEKGTELTAAIIEQLRGDFKKLPGGYAARFEKYLQTPAYAPRERHILKAAHFLSTYWEFQIIDPLNSGMHGIEATRTEISDQLHDYDAIPAYKKILKDEKLYGFLNLCGQLRFQQRWAQTPRVPKTSVLGHMLIVAMLSYFVSLEIEACPKRLYNNFFGSLFHDLPEILTRDIVRSVKYSVKGLDAIIKEYEHKQVNEKILPLIPPGWHGEIKYFVQDEFANKIATAGLGNAAAVRIVDCIKPAWNRDEYMPYDGEIIEICDKLSAFVEASLSIEYGIRSASLVTAKKKVYHQYRSTKLCGFDFGKLFSYFN
jgi:putative hydrolase of HD superfamily